MTTYSKIKWILGILIIFVLIVATNMIDREHFQRVRNAVVSIYEDRLVAKSLIFEISKLIQTKELAAVTSDSTFFLEQNTQVDKDINTLIMQFGATNFTSDEKNVFSEFENSVQNLKAAEIAFVQSNFNQKAPLVEQLSVVKQNLYSLSKIQLDEGKRQLAISQKSVNTVELFTHLEIYMLIFMAILIQIIIMYQPKKES